MPAAWSSLRACGLALLAGSAAAAATPDCDGLQAGTYCVGPFIAPFFPLNHTILKCPGSTTTTCPSGSYCGPKEVTGDDYGHSECHMLSTAVAAPVAPSPCESLKAGTYCVGPLAQWIKVNHTILKCPEGTTTDCGHGGYCGPKEVTGDEVDHAQCHALREPSPPMKVVAPAVLAQASPEFSLCSPCTQLGGQALNILLNYILNAGVVGSCGKLCSQIKSKAGSTACELVCSAVGIEAFIKALKHVDLDTIFFCEVLHLCKPGPDNATISVLPAQAQPASVAKGATVTLSVGLKVTEPSGVGEFLIDVDGPVTQPVSQGFLLPDGLAATVGSLSVQLTPQDDDSGDFPVIWSPGRYNFTIEVCQGECGSKHPHSKVFGTQTGFFTLTESMQVVV